MTRALQYGTAPQRHALRRSDSELLTCFYEDTSSVRDGHSVAIIADPKLTRCRHLAGKKAHKAKYQEAAERILLNPQPEYPFYASVPNHQQEQTQLSIYSWNQGPRRGSPALQEAIEYLQHERITNHYFVTHFACCAVLFNKDTFHSNLQVNSIYIHDTRKSSSSEEAQAGWVLQPVISRARFWRAPRRKATFHHDVAAFQQPLCQETRARDS